MLNTIAIITGIITDMCFISSILAAFVPKIRHRFTEHLAQHLAYYMRTPSLPQQKEPARDTTEVWNSMMDEDVQEAKLIKDDKPPVL